MDEHNKLMDFVFMHRKEARSDTIAEFANAIDLELSGIATLAKSNPRLAKRCKRLHRILTEFGMELKFFEEDIKEL